MAKHRHILVPHCKGRQGCQWLVCITCGGYGVLDKRWAVNPYKFSKEPDVSSS